MPPTNSYQTQVQPQIERHRYQPYHQATRLRPHTHLIRDVADTLVVSSKEFKRTEPSAKTVLAQDELAHDNLMPAPVFENRPNIESLRAFP
jgi:hypothetical protein